MRVLGCIGVVAGTLFFSLQASAEDASPPPGDVVQPQEVVPGAVRDPRGSDAPGGLRAIAKAVLVGIVDLELTKVAHVVEHFERLAESLRPSEDEVFDAKIARAERVHRFMQKLEADRAATEAQQFDAELDRFLRKTEFLKRLTARRNASLESGHWDLYERE